MTSHTHAAQVEILDAKLGTLVPAAYSQGSCASQQSASDLLREMKVATAVVGASAAAAAAEAAISEAGGGASGDGDGDDAMPPS